MELVDARTKLCLFVVACFVQLVNSHARTSRADVSTVLGEKEDPNFWPSRGRRNNLEHKLKQYMERMYNKNTLHAFKGRYEKPLYVDEPTWLTIDTSRRTDGDDDYFWITRGRRDSSDWKHSTVGARHSTGFNRLYRRDDESDNNKYEMEKRKK